MIDIHCHILAGIDDGARDMDMSLEMARIAVADGISTIVCTPHITPGIYNNDTGIINEQINRLKEALVENNIALELLSGADIHVAPDLSTCLDQGIYPTIAGTRYFLFEPPHHVVPPRIVELARQLINQGYIPVLTHPERLTWIEGHYEIIEQLDEAGVAVQITAAAITGRFGKRPLYWSERMLDEGRVDIIASDAHNLTGRPPVLSAARDAVSARLGEKTGHDMVYDNPLLILNNALLPNKKRKKVHNRQKKAHKSQETIAEKLFRFAGWNRGGKNPRH